MTPIRPPGKPGEPRRAGPEDVAELLARAREQSAARMGVQGYSLSGSLILVSRVLSVLVAGCYFYLAPSFGIPKIRVVQFLVLPLLVVCFPETLSRATGRLGPGEVIRRASPPRLALALGWAVLLMPVWVWAISS